MTPTTTLYVCGLALGAAFALLWHSARLICDARKALKEARRTLEEAEKGAPKLRLFLMTEKDEQAEIQVKGHGHA